MPVLAPARISHMRSVCWGRFMLEHFHVDIRTDTSNNRRKITRVVFLFALVLVLLSVLFFTLFAFVFVLLPVHFFTFFALFFVQPVVYVRTNMY
ncbi:Protein hob3 [Verticillium dahliae VDG1]|nr:Protein hob3 [Verticillium dahliae VDG1]